MLTARAAMIPAEFCNGTLAEKIEDNLQNLPADCDPMHRRYCLPVAADGALWSCCKIKWSNSCKMVHL